MGYRSYVIKSTLEDDSISLGDIFVGAAPFVLMMLICLILIIFFSNHCNWVGIEGIMMRKFIDLSIPLEAGIASDPEIMLPEIEYFSHKDTADQMVNFFPGMTTEELPSGEGWGD